MTIFTAILATLTLATILAGITLRIRKTAPVKTRK